MSDLSTKDLRVAIEAGFVHLTGLLHQVMTEGVARDGKLVLLSTQEKATLVGAINETYALAKAAAVIDDDEVNLTHTLSSHAIQAKINAAVAGILGGVDEDNDTLKELADALAAQAAASAGLLALNTAQELTDEQKQRGRDNLGLGALATKDTQIDDLKESGEVGTAWSSAKTKEYVDTKVAAINIDLLQTKADFAAQIAAKWSALQATQAG